MMLSHDVFFTLFEPTAERRAQLVQECTTWLKGHEGMVVFSAGVRVEENQRDVNDTAFDVSMHAVFRDKEAHDAYQKAPRHREFVTRNKAGWKQVRVFDSTITQ